MNLTLPLDFERLPEFWQLTESLRVRVVPKIGGDSRAEQMEAVVNETAILLLMRLWVVLGYLARHTNRPGWLNAAGERQLNGAFTQFGEDCPPVQVLEGSLLRKGEDGWYCDLFTQHNRHLSGDHVSSERMGNMRSRMAAARTNIAASALQQGNLLPFETYKKHDGTPMDDRSRQRCMVIIITIDRCLNPVGFRPVQRSAGSYTDGLMADACDMFEALKEDELQTFYEWLHLNREKPATPKTTEDVLRDWKVVWKASLL